jgi:hypothetical protein
MLVHHIDRSSILVLRVVEVLILVQCASPLDSSELGLEDAPFIDCASDVSQEILTLKKRSKRKDQETSSDECPEGEQEDPCKDKPPPNMCATCDSKNMDPLKGIEKEEEGAKNYLTNLEPKLSQVCNKRAEALWHFETNMTVDTAKNLVNELVCVCIYVFICTYICIYIYIYERP